MPSFIPGIKLSETYFLEAIQPLMAQNFPEINYSAARLEWGSDVMGFDTPMSMDHGWGPKMTLFLSQSNLLTHQQVMDDFFANNLPFEIHGYPTNFGEPFSDGGVMQAKNTYPIRHMITITTPEKFFMDHLGIAIDEFPLSPRQWLCLPQQKLFTLRSGRIFHDGLGNLSKIREQFHWYPRDLWCYLMSAQWQRINQEEPFPGRANSAGDVLGSHLIAARIIRDLMQLCFLMERKYAPYSKWYGTAFQQLTIAPQLSPLFMDILISSDWKTREAQLSEAYRLVMDKHNALKITPKLEVMISNFHQRPFLVPQSGRFADALLAQINDRAVKDLPSFLGSIDQIVDNTDLLENIPLCHKLQTLY